MVGETPLRVSTRRSKPSTSHFQPSDLALSDPRSVRRSPRLCAPTMAAEKTPRFSPRRVKLSPSSSQTSDFTMSDSNSVRRSPRLCAPTIAAESTPRISPKRVKPSPSPCKPPDLTMSDPRSDRRPSRLCVSSENANLTEEAPAEKQPSKELNTSSASTNERKRSRIVSVFVGDPVPDMEARRRWPWRYKEDGRNKGQSLKSEDDEDELVLNVKCHYFQAAVENCIFNIGDCAYVKGEKGGQNYVGRILEFFKTMDDEDYFRVQWFFRAEDTVMKEEAASHDKKRLFYSNLMNDNLLDCIVSKVKVVQIAPDLNFKEKSIPPCDFYYDMEYSVDYSTFCTTVAGNCADNSNLSQSACLETVHANDTKPKCEELCNHKPYKSEVALLDIFSGCGGMSTGLCLGAKLSGLDLVTRWALDINKFACESLKLNHPETQIRNESAEDFLDLLKEWDTLCKQYGVKDVGETPKSKSRFLREAQENLYSKNDEKIPSGEYEVASLVDICYGDPSDTGVRGLKFQARMNIGRKGVHYLQKLNAANVPTDLLERGQNRVIEASLTLIRERAKLKGELVRALGGALASSSLLGVPLGHNSSFLQGPAFAPPRIREAIWCGSTNATTEEGKELNDPRVLSDVGDVPVQGIRDCGVDDDRLMNIISESVKLVMEEDPLRPLVLGGDHSISFPVVRAVSEKLGGPVDILHLDAHPDIYHAFEGNKYSHASSFARIMEGGYARRLLQVGIRSITSEGREQGKKFGVEQFEMRTFSRDRHLLENLKLGEGVKGVYISVDVDCLDPAFAPGVSHIEPGGLSFRDVLNILHNLQADVVAADVVEFNPQRDTVDGMTAMVAAKLVRELTAKISK